MTLYMRSLSVPLCSREQIKSFSLSQVDALTAEEELPYSRQLALKLAVAMISDNADIPRSDNIEDQIWDGVDGIFRQQQILAKRAVSDHD